MTREESINQLRYIIDVANKNDCNIKEIDGIDEEAIEIAIKALEHPEQNVIAVVPCGDAISREAVLSMQYRIDDSATLSTRDVVNVDDIEDLPSVNPQPTHEDIAKAFQLGLAFGFGEKYDEMDSVIDEIKKVITPQPKTGHWIDDKCSVCGKGIEDLIDSREWYRNEQPNFCPFCGLKLADS